MLFEDHMDELMHLTQSWSIKEYLDQFDEIMNCVDLTDSYAINFILGGLKLEIALQVRMFRPKTCRK